MLYGHYTSVKVKAKVLRWSEAQMKTEIYWNGLLVSSFKKKWARMIASSPPLPTHTPISFQKAAICPSLKEWLFLPATYCLSVFLTHKPNPKPLADYQGCCRHVTPNCEIILFFYLESNHRKNPKGLYCQSSRREANQCLIKQSLWSLRVQADFSVWGWK